VRSEYRFQACAQRAISARPRACVGRDYELAPTRSGLSGRRARGWENDARSSSFEIERAAAAPAGISPEFRPGAPTPPKDDPNRPARVASGARETLTVRLILGALGGDAAVVLYWRPAHSADVRRVVVALRETLTTVVANGGLDDPAFFRPNNNVRNLSSRTSSPAERPRTPRRMPRCS
jgi:hypothetical protein